MGEERAPDAHPAVASRWQRLGMLGLLSDEETVAAGAEVRRRVVLEEPESRAQGWSILSEVFATLIERSVEHELSKEPAADERQTTSGDLCKGVLVPTAGAGDDRVATG